jgi:folate-binding protein YgfZ
MTQIFGRVRVLHISGQDSQSFLSNQLVSGISSLNALSYSAICNPKGRMLFSLWIQPAEDGYLLGVDDSLAEALTQYIMMRRFRMDFKVTQTQHQLQASGQHIAHYDLSQFSFTTDQANQSDDAFWRDVFALNLPWITSQTTELFIPQHVNLDLAELIAYDKGCYPGQEIVARLHFIGKVKKRLQLITYQHEQPHQPGQVVEIDDVPQPVEICAPSIKTGQKWQTQAIVPI